MMPVVANRILALTRALLLLLLSPSQSLAALATAKGAVEDALGVAVDASRCPGRCSGRGICRARGELAACECEDNYVGHDCSFLLELGSLTLEAVAAKEADTSCAIACVNGRCSSGQCECHDGFSGPACDQQRCPNDCFGRGSCSMGVCRCEAGWTGVQCESEAALVLADVADNMLQQTAQQSAPAAAAAPPMADAAAAATASTGVALPATAVSAVPAVGLTELLAKSGDQTSAVAFAQAQLAARTAAEAADRLLALAAEQNERDAARRIKFALRRARINAEQLPGHNFSLPEVENNLAALLLEATEDDGCVSTGCSSHGRCNSTTGLCECEVGWRGRFCDLEPCPDDCSGNGLCVAKTCVCSQGFYGRSCQHRRCPEDCNGNGYCFNGRCQCAGDYGGESCSEIVHHPAAVMRLTLEKRHEPGLRGFAKPQVSTLRASPGVSCPNDCSGHGTCRDGTCDCDSGFSGASCQESCPNGCSGNGDCVQGACLCLAGFQGADCSQETCCSGHGACLADQVCACDEGWTGKNCEVKLSCPDPTCSGRGVCAPATGRCMCGLGYKGESCEIAAPTCTGLCGNHGVCDEASGICKCSPGFKGELCNVPNLQCPSNCSSHGTCAHGLCLCDSGWSGLACENQAAPAALMAALQAKALEVQDDPVTLPWFQRVHPVVDAATVPKRSAGQPGAAARSTAALSHPVGSPLPGSALLASLRRRLLPAQSPAALGS